MKALLGAIELLVNVLPHADRSSSCTEIHGDGDSQWVEKLQLRHSKA